MFERGIAYRYDGSLDGFLCCIFESYVRKEIPAMILSDQAPQGVLYPEKWIETVPQQADRVFASLSRKISKEAERIIQTVFLTCLEDKEMHLYRFIRMGYQYGAQVTNWLADPTVHAIRQAMVHLQNEEQKIKGFLRFSEHQGVLISVIEPKNSVLPVIADHFCSRYPEERFFIYDKAHRLVLWYEPYQAKFLEIDSFLPPARVEEEKEIASLWKQFVKTIAVEGRINPRCQMTMMPKRYWNHMLEHADQLTAKQRGTWKKTTAEFCDTGFQGKSRIMEEKRQ